MTANTTDTTANTTNRVNTTNRANTTDRVNTTTTANGSNALHSASAAGPETAPPRLDFAKSARTAFRALIGFDAAARQGLDPALVELVQIRASHLNHCAYCLHMHTTDARKAGESEDRLHMIPVWREARHFFTAREQAALALTEAVTLVADAGVPDDVYAEAAAHFDDTELAHVLALIFTINTWNRIALSTAKQAGTDTR